MFDSPLIHIQQPDGSFKKAILVNNKIEYLRNEIEGIHQYQLTFKYTVDTRKTI